MSTATTTMRTMSGRLRSSGMMISRTMVTRLDNGETNR